jgi:hypothetical protein
MLLMVYIAASRNGDKQATDTKSSSIEFLPCITLPIRAG